MDDDENTIDMDLRCVICGQAADFIGLKPVQTEYLIGVWAREHAHTVKERLAQRRELLTSGDDDPDL